MYPDVIFFIQAISELTLVYNPGYLGSPHPTPVLTTPTWGMKNLWIALYLSLPSSLNDRCRTPWIPLASVNTWDVWLVTTRGQTSEKEGRRTWFMATDMFGNYCEDPFKHFLALSIWDDFDLRIEKIDFVIFATSASWRTLFPFRFPLLSPPMPMLLRNLCVFDFL